MFASLASAIAQDAPEFKVGDRVKTPDHAGAATIVKLQGGWATVKYDDMQGEYEVMSSKITQLNTNSKPVTNNNVTPQNGPKKNQNAGQVTNANNNSQFKVGDRVKVAITGRKDEELQSCTITRGLKDNQYGIRCDPYKKLPYMDYNVLPEWVHAWNNATAAPKLDCSFETPAGTVSKNAFASEQLFKRVIYEQMAAIEKVKLGMQFTSFQIGTPFKNVMTGNGLLKTFVPQNAMFYPVKAQFITCKQGTLEFNHRQTTKQNFGCYKDRFGDWVCGADGVPSFSDDQEVPKK